MKLGVGQAVGLEFSKAILYFGQLLIRRLIVIDIRERAEIVGGKRSSANERHTQEIRSEGLPHTAHRFFLRRVP